MKAVSPMNYHPYSEILPLLDRERLEELVADIKENGLREPIWLYEGKILDGRNRFAACLIAKVKPTYRKYTGTSPLAFVISLNIHRRHLSESQRSMAAAKIATITHGGDRRSDQAANLPTVTQAFAAKALNVSERSVRSARKIIDEGSKALQKAVENGEIAVSKGASVVGLPKSEQLGAATEKKPAKPVIVEITPAPDFDFTDYEPEDDEAYRRSIDNVMMADDKLAAMRDELKQVRREMQSLKASRDHYQSESGQAVRLVKARDRDIEKLNKLLTKAREENESLQERIAIMEAA